MEEDSEVEQGPSPEEIEFALTTARYDEVLSTCKLLRSRLLMITGNSSKIPQMHSSPSEIGSVIDCLNQMEEQIHRLSTQELMLEKIKMSSLALELFSSPGPYDGLEDLLKEHCANQAKLFELAKSIKAERLNQKKRMGQLLDHLCQYSASLKDDQTKLDTSSTSNSESTLEMKKGLEKQLKEIRFMQICISQIIANKDIDLSELDTIRRILKSVRDPITTLEHFA